jgi:phenylalanyl-tRNA synthetase alpha chain
MAELNPEQRAEIEAAREAALAAIAGAADERALEAARVEYLGKSGRVSLLRRNIGKLPASLKPVYGEAVNRVVAAVEEALEARRGAIAREKLAAELAGPKLDVTLAGRPVRAGRRHPISRTLDDMVEVLARMGYAVAGGPEVELDFYNFEALAIPKDHPARDMQDTFYVDDSVLPKGAVPPGEVLLRTHTSPVQVRTMLGRKPPVRIIAPGRVYRCDSDQTHTPNFHQIEGLYVDHGVTFADLKGTLDAFVKGLFGSDVRTRFRPSYFPFTEPSAEVDISCVICGGSGLSGSGRSVRLAAPVPEPGRPLSSVGDKPVPAPASGPPCRVCKGTGWLEILGAGLVDPEVFRYVGYDPEVVSGFAFGLGVERVAMLRYGIDDLRSMYENDVRFLSQF